MNLCLLICEYFLLLFICLFFVLYFCTHIPWYSSLLLVLYSGTIPSGAQWPYGMLEIKADSAICKVTMLHIKQYLYFLVDLLSSIICICIIFEEKWWWACECMIMILLRPSKYTLILCMLKELTHKGSFGMGQNLFKVSL